MGDRLARRRGTWLACVSQLLSRVLLIVPLLAAGCAHHATALPHVEPMPVTRLVPPPDGSYYRLQPGETLWRIGRDFGLDSRALAAANHLRSPTQVKTGQLLFIPEPPESSYFLWPARGTLSRSHGTTNESGTPGLEIASADGTLVRASRSGRVAVATKRLAGLGSTVILDHGDGYVSIYSGLDQILVTPGTAVRQGSPVGQIGRTPLYFEIRYRTRPRDPLSLLP